MSPGSIDWLQGRLVDRYSRPPPSTRAAGNDHVDRRHIDLQPGRGQVPELGRVIMAQYSLAAARHHRGKHVRMWRQGVVAHGVHAGVDPVKPAALDAMSDRAPGEAKAAELVPRHEPVLAACQVSDALLYMHDWSIGTRAGGLRHLCRTVMHEWQRAREAAESCHLCRVAVGRARINAWMCRHRRGGEAICRVGWPDRRRMREEDG
jgi:hypothetical protein